MSLARSLVWTDVWALEAALDNASASDVRAGGCARRCSMPIRARSSATRKARGLRSRAMRFASRFVRALMDLGAALERAGDWTTAIDVYRRGLEADNLAESFYRGLMRALACHRQPRGSADRFSAAAASFCRSCSASSRRRKPIAFIARSSPARTDKRSERLPPVERGRRRSSRGAAVATAPLLLHVPRVQFFDA
jgi:hypothetical protein